MLFTVQRGKITKGTIKKINKCHKSARIKDNIVRYDPSLGCIRPPPPSFPFPSRFSFAHEDANVIPLSPLDRQPPLSSQTAHSRKTLRNRTVTRRRGKN